MADDGGEADEADPKFRTRMARAKAISALGNGMSNRGAARHADVDEGMIRRWLKQRSFIDEVEAIQQQRMVEAERRLRGRVARTAQFMAEVACGRRDASGPQITAARDLLERLHVGKASRVERIDPIAAMTDDELEAVIKKGS